MEIQDAALLVRVVESEFSYIKLDEEKDDE